MANPKPGRFQLRLHHLFIVVIAVSCLSWAVFRPDTYEQEEVSSNYDYPPNYKIKPIGEQIAILRQYFPELGSVDVSVAGRPLPEGAEGYFAIPRWEKLAPTYQQAMDRIMAALQKAYGDKPINYLTRGSNYFRQTERSRIAWRSMGVLQKDQDILIVPAQFGKRHAGRSVRRARVVMKRGEFGLGAYEVGIMLLTNPERLSNPRVLNIECAGDEKDFPGMVIYYKNGVISNVDFCPDKTPSLVPRFRFFDDKVDLHGRFFDSTDDDYGSASAFLPR